MILPWSPRTRALHTSSLAPARKRYVYRPTYISICRCIYLYSIYISTYRHISIYNHDPSFGSKNKSPSHFIACTSPRKIYVYRTYLHIYMQVYIPIFNIYISTYRYTYLFIIMILPSGPRTRALHTSSLAQNLGSPIHKYRSTYTSICRCVYIVYTYTYRYISVYNHEPSFGSKNQSPSHFIAFTSPQKIYIYRPIYISICRCIYLYSIYISTYRYTYLFIIIILLSGPRIRALHTSSLAPNHGSPIHKYRSSYTSICRCVYIVYTYTYRYISIYNHEPSFGSKNQSPSHFIACTRPRKSNSSYLQHGGGCE